MKTLADLKRTLKPGMILALEHLQAVWNPVPRKVTSVNTVGFTLETVKPDGKIVQSHATWPKASYFEPLENGFLFYSDWHVGNVEQKRVPLLKYTFVDNV